MIPQKDDKCANRRIIIYLETSQSNGENLMIHSHQIDIYQMIQIDVFITNLIE